MPPKASFPTGSKNQTDAVKNSATHPTAKGKGVLQNASSNATLHQGFAANANIVQPPSGYQEYPPTGSDMRLTLRDKRDLLDIFGNVINDPNDNLTNEEKTKIFNKWNPRQNGKSWSEAELLNIRASLMKDMVMPSALDGEINRLEIDDNWEDEETWAVLKVGPGVAHETPEKIMDRFKQLTHEKLLANLQSLEPRYLWWEEKQQLNERWENLSPKTFYQIQHRYNVLKLTGLTTAGISKLVGG